MNKTLLSELQNDFTDDQLITDKNQLSAYQTDYSLIPGDASAVVFAKSHEDVIKVVKFCNQHHIALVTRGAGTGTTGAAVPFNGAIVLSLEKMNQIISVDKANRIMVVEPGVTNQAVQDAAEAHGFFWPPDPGSAPTCTVGGNLACNAAGPKAVKYGTCRENVLGLAAVTGNGDSIKAGVRTTKGVVGYDLTRLLIGSEGTLGIITEAILKLTPLPETVYTMAAIYQDMKHASAAVSDIMAQPITPCALEMMDRRALQLIRENSEVEIPLDAGAMLIIEIDGPEALMAPGREAIQKAASNAGLQRFYNPKSQQEINQIWQARKALSPALRTVAPKKINEDVVVPVSEIPTLTSEIETLAEAYNIIIITFGHAGNGNLHVNLMIDPNDATQVKHAKICLHKIFELVLKLGGTLSGEHGIGVLKREFVSLEIDTSTLSLMQAIKKQFDANCILNPGKAL